MRAESLQRRPSCSFEAFVATWTITCVNKKNFADALCDDPRVPPSGVTAHVQTVAAVLDGERFVLAVSGDRFQTAAIAAGFSIVTTASPSPGIPRCSSVPSDVSAEISFRIPSTNTFGFAAGVIAACSVALCPGVAFSGELTDLDWGSREGSLPESSSLGGDGTPLRGAFIRDSGTHNREDFISFVGLATFSSPSSRSGLAHSGPPKWPILSPPPTTNGKVYLRSVSL
jgi:hypothetical protein